MVSPYSGEYNGPVLPLPTEEKPFTFTWDDEYAAEDETRPFSWVKTDVAGYPEGREVKGFPRGLDVMAVFGSDRAGEILTETGDNQYSDYNKKFNELKTEIDALSQEDWHQNLYYNWF